MFMSSTIGHPYMSNHIMSADSYKFSHFYQDPPNTTFKQSYVTARGMPTSFAGIQQSVVSFGISAFVQEYMTKQINFNQVERSRRFAERHGVPFNEAGWKRIVNKHNGYLPIQIRALKEGTLVLPNVAQVVVQNTDPELPWLSSYVETEVLRSIWYPTTVATLSNAAKKMIYKAFLKTSDVETADAQIDFKLHDFGQRGASSLESAGLGGMAHLVNFKGTDTTAGILAVESYYDTEFQMPGFSVPAMEHSTVTVWGRENEADAYANMLRKSPPGIVSFVSDSYDIYEACRSIWGEQLRQEVIDSGKTVVIRPDSGDPVTVVLNVLTILGEKFGFTVNRKGFRVLNNVRVLQGDGIDLTMIGKICTAMINAGWAIDNIVFGMGGALLQGVTRDTLKYAMKCNAAIVNGELVEVFKDPITDSGKRSFRGPISVIGDGALVNHRDEQWTAHMQENLAWGLTAPYEPNDDVMETVYFNGDFAHGSIKNFNEIRERAWKEPRQYLIDHIK